MKSILSNIILLLISMNAFAGFSWEEVYESNNCLVPCFIRHKNNCILILGPKNDVYPYLAECGYINKEKKENILIEPEISEIEEKEIEIVEEKVKIYVDIDKKRGALF